MADIDQIIAGGAKTNADFDFGKLNKSYWEGQDQKAKNEDQKAKNDLRDAFKGGLPMKGDQVDWPAVTQKFFSVGANDQGMAAAGQALAQQKMEYGQRSAADAFPTGQAPPPAQAPIVSPPSVSAPRLKEVAAPLNKGGVQGSSPQGDQPGSIVGLLSAAGISDELQGPYINQLSAKFKTDPNATLDPQMSARVQEVIQAAAQRMKAGQPQQAPQVAQAPMQPQMQPAQQQPDFNQRFNAARPGSDATLGGLVPAGRTPQQQIGLLSRQNASGNLSPEAAKVNQSHIEAIQKAIERPTEEKLYDKAVSQGYKGTLEDWQNRADDNTTQRDILNKSTIPRLEKSQETATAARDDIDAIHRARNELDQKGGVFSGAAADKKLYLAKAAELLGIPNADKIQNTEAYSAAIGQRVAVMVKAFGSGTAISDGDRRFAAAMAGGQVTLEEGSMRRILDIAEKANRGKINYHNQNVDEAVKTNEGLKPSRGSYLVKAPGEYKKPDSTSLAFSSARDAIAKGAPRDAVMKRLKENGHDPAGL